MATSFGLYPTTRYPFAWLPPEWDFGTTDPFAALLAAGDAQLTYLLVAEPFDGTLEGETLGLPAPFAYQPLAWSPTVTYLGGTRGVYLADQPYLSRATDSPPNQPFPAVLEPAYSISGTIGSIDDPIGNGEVQIGDVAIRNGSGDRDALVNYGWIGRLLEIRAGSKTTTYERTGPYIVSPDWFLADGVWSDDGAWLDDVPWPEPPREYVQRTVDWPLSDFATILRGTVSGIRWNEETIHLTPALRTALFDQLITRTYYAGTGDEQGPAEIAGQPIPIALGRCRQVPMQQLDAGKQIWRAAETVDSFITVRDIGLTVTPSGTNHADYAAIDAATVPSGEYHTCASLGLVRFGSDVTLPTCDIDGDSAAGATVPDMIEWLVTTRLRSGVKLAPSEIDGGAFNRANDARGWTAGLLIAEETAMQDAMLTLARSIGAYAMPTRAGLLSLGLYALPADPSATLTARQVDDAGPELESLLRPARQVTVGYRPNVRPLTDAEMSETITDREAFRQSFRTVVAVAASTPRDAVDYRIDTTLDDADDAGDLADILIAMLSRTTQRYRVPLRTLTLPYWLGDRVRFEYPRWGLDSGVTYIVVGLDESSDGTRSLVLLGPPPV